MSVRVVDRVWKCSRARQGDLLVLLALADYANDAGVCWPGISAIAKKCRISPRSVQRSIRELEALGEVFVEKGQGKEARGGFTSRYQIVTSCQNDVPSDCHPVTNGAQPPDRSCVDPVSPVSPKPSERIVKGTLNKVRIAKFDPSAVELPFQSAEFRLAWAEWCQHRRELRKPLTATSVTRQLASLERLGEERAKAAIAHSIRQGWTGIYEAKHQPLTQNEQPIAAGEPWY